MSAAYSESFLVPHRVERDCRELTVSRQSDLIVCGLS